MYKSRRFYMQPLFKTAPARQVVILTYLCRAENKDVILSKEHMDYHWSNKDQLRSKLAPEIIRDFERYDARLKSRHRFEDWNEIVNLLLS